MIKEERFKSILGILMVPVLILVVVGFCMARSGSGGVWTGIVTNGGEAENDTENAGKTLEERGYVLFQPINQGIKQLMNQGIIEPFYDTVDEETSVLSFEEIERGDYLKENPFVVEKSPTLSEYLMTTELSFDSQQGKFTCTDLISKIEAAGFTGFEEQLEKVTRLIRCCKKHDGEGEEVQPTYYFYCQGVEFRLDETSGEAFLLGLQFNFSSCYVPAKYQEFIKDVVSGGEYFLYASTVGGEMETLTFSKDNSVSFLGENVDEEIGKIVDNKRIVFMFRDGKLVDYYIVVQGGELKLDDSDKNLIDKYAKGIGKGYPDKAMTFSKYGGDKRIYRT